MLSEPVSVTLQVTKILEKSGITYVIGGSMASTAHGRIRTTMDVDIVDGGVGRAVGRDADADRDQPRPRGLVEPDPQGDTDGSREDQRVGVVELQPMVGGAVMAAVEADPDAVHHEPVGRCGDRFHHGEGDERQHDHDGDDTPVVTARRIGPGRRRSSSH